MNRQHQKVINRYLAPGFSDRNARMIGFPSVKALGSFFVQLNNRDPEAVWFARALTGLTDKTVNQVRENLEENKPLAIPQLSYTFLKRPETVQRTRSMRDTIDLLQRKDLPADLGRGELNGRINFTIRARPMGSDDWKEFSRSVPLDGISNSRLNAAVTAQAESLLREYQYFDELEFKDNFVTFSGHDADTNRPFPLRHIMMRSVGLEIDGLPQPWDKDDGLCVFNALKAAYDTPINRMQRFWAKGPEHFFDILTKIYHKTSADLDPEDEYDRNYDAKTHGPTPFLIVEGFCKPNGIPCHCMDSNGICFYSYEPKDRHKQRHTLCFRVQGNHIFLEKAKAQSLSKALSSTLPGIQQTGKGIGDKELVLLDDNESDGMEHLRKVIAEHGCAPQGWKITMAHDKIVSWELGKKVYVLPSDSITKAQQLMANMDRPWEGETVAGVIQELVKKCFGPNGLPRTQPNPEARAVLTAPGIMDRAPYGLTKAGAAIKGDLEEMIKDGRAITWDETKSHGSSLYNPEEPWCNVGPHDRVVDIDEDLQSLFDPTQPGLYFCDVEEEEHPLFRRGTNWYCRALVKDARKRKLKFKVLHHLECTVSYPRDHYRGLLCSFVEVAKGDADLYKALITHLSGYLGKTRKESSTMYIDKDPNVVWANYRNKVNDASTMVAPKRVLVDANGKVTEHHRPCEHPNATPIAPVSLSNTSICRHCSNKLEDVHHLVDGNLYCHQCQMDGKTPEHGCPPKHYEEYFMYGTRRVCQLAEQSVTHYIQVLDFANMRLARWEDQLGEVYLRKTDCVVAAPPPKNPKQAPRAPCDHEDPKVRAAVSTWGRYKQVMATPKVHRRLMPVSVPPPKRRNWFRYHHICDSNQYQDVLNLVLDQGRVLINGGPGTGKTWMGLKVGAMLENMGLKVQYMAFTNMAAMNIDGLTIDRAIGLRSTEDADDNDASFFSTKWVKALRKYGAFVIDEVSLIPGPRLAALETLAQAFPTAKFILIGDRDQCGYVEPGAKHQDVWPDYFDHPTMIELAGGNWVNLVVRHRSKCPKLDITMDRLRAGERLPSGLPRGCMPLSLSFTNRIRNRVNANQNYQYFKEAKAKGLVIKVLQANQHGKQMYMFRGVPLQAKDNKKRGFKAEEAPHGRVFLANNEMFKVHSIRGRWVTLETQRRRRIPGTIEFEQYPYFIVVALSAIQQWFKLAYCITVHSAQGCTFTEPFTIWEAHRMERRILYTAVGRAQRLEQVHLPPKELAHLEYVDEAKEARDRYFIKAKLDNYKQQDNDKGHHHSPEEYPSPADILDDLIRCGYTCDRCQREVKLIKNYDPHNRDPRQWTLQRLDNRKGHILGNLANFCYECNVSRPEVSHMAPVDEE